MPLKIGIKSVTCLVILRNWCLYAGYCYALDNILEGMDELDDKTYWCITSKFHDYMNHAVYENEQPLVSYLYQLHNDGFDTFDLLDLYDDMRKSLADLLPNPIIRGRHDYSESSEMFYTLVLHARGTCFYTTVSKN